jgi:chemotaxis protein MotB
VGEQGASIRIVKRKKGHQAHHGGAWKVAYADFVTAMMAFFLVMWIVGLSQNIKESISGYFKDPAGFMQAVKAGNAPFDAGLKNNKTTPETPEQKKTERDKLEQAKKTIEKMVADSPEFKDLKNYVDIKLTDEGLKVELLEAKESLFFDSASAKIKPSTQVMLGKMAAELRKLPNKLIIEGHTDNRPLSRQDGYTNWELSSDRANSARHVMEAAGLRPGQVVQVRGYADTQPRDPANPGHFSNRRVSIVVITNEALKRQQLGAEVAPAPVSR